ncbi:hypothetical protein NP233_g5665 [Leucocoprinus birnbaumii]|uniref:Endo-beta-1,2-glucanase SGL domain-containing protein n=1 Tax=Leucocoprinus birnbaumii TaxID=56174 RepID=A0AAD5VUS1_9AGAR|nr:hypothetical protein NP233_g5665 [Leucocoprinus birnbaumii]
MGFTPLSRLSYLTSILALTLPTLVSSSPPSCRFASQYTPSQILSSPQSFENDLLYWEGKFHQHNVSYNALNGMTFDGTGDPGAVRWILSGEGVSDNGLNDVEKARNVAVGILEKKWESYRTFNETFPGFGGFLPWFAHSEFTPLTPTWDWNNRVPALDNGENIWGIYATIEALQRVGKKRYTDLANKWEGYLNYLKTTAARVFYHGSGQICAVAAINNQSLTVDHPDQSYTCEGLGSGGNPFIDDPYEGQSFMFFLYLFGSLNQTDKTALLEFKRPQLVSVDWAMQGYQNVSVQKGFWFSAHENWGWMQLPYTDIPLMRNLYENMERARTCDSHAKRLPGMFASINNSTDQNGEIIGYISNAGIPAIANQTVQELDVITPYSTMNTMIVNKTVGLLWWYNMAKARRMQSMFYDQPPPLLALLIELVNIDLYGSSESTRIDGTATSAFVSWDSKVTTVNGLLGGVASLVRARMQRQGVYEEFIRVVTEEYGRVFSSPLKGTSQGFCLPDIEVEDVGLVDFTTCQV